MQIASFLIFNSNSKKIILTNHSFSFIILIARGKSKLLLADRYNLVCFFFYIFQSTKNNNHYLFIFQISNDGRKQSFENRVFVKLSFQYSSSFSANPRLFEYPDFAVNPRRFSIHRILAT